MSVVQTVRNFLRSRRLDDEFADEIAFHIEMRTRENLAAGMSADHARRSALRQFGNRTKYRAQMRNIWTPGWLDQTFQDIRHSARSLRGNPGFALVVIATLSIAIGMNTAVFSLVEAIMIRPLPYPSANRLVWIALYTRDFQPEIDNRVPRNDYLKLQSRSTTLESVAAYGNQDLALDFRGESSQERIASITGSFWSLTGATAEIGSLFDENAAHTIVLSHDFYERRFHKDPGVLGKTVTINGYAFRIVGVLAPQYRFWLPQQMFYDDESRDIDAYIPIPPSTLDVGLMGRSAWEEVVRQTGPGPLYLNVFGLRKANVTLKKSSAELQSLTQQIANEHKPEQRVFDRTIGWRMLDLKTKVAGINTEHAFMILMCAVFLILVIACCNIANLFLVRTMQRRHEFAIRVSLGASRMRILRQLLAESICLSIVGGIVGMGLAEVTIKVVGHLWPQTISRLTEASLDLPSMSLAFLLSLVTGILFGVAPTMLAFPVSPDSSLREQSISASGGVERTRIRRWLVVSEMALALVLLAGTGLLVRSFSRMTSNPPGFEPDRIVTLHVSLAGPAYQDWPSQSAYIDRATARLIQESDAASVGISGQMLQTPSGVVGLPDAVRTMASVRAVSVGYLHAMGIGLVSGQWPSDSAFDDSVLVNEAFARAMGRGTNIVGMHIRAGYLTSRIAGIVSDFRSSQLDAAPIPEVYGSYKLAPLTTPWSVRFYVRTTQAAPDTKALQQILTSTDPSQPVFDVQTMEHALADYIAPRKLLLFLMGIFSAIALLLAVIGLYGVISYSVSLRTQEIGIRMALGANRTNILWMVVREGLKAVACGVAIGLVLSVTVTPLIQRQLYKTAPSDPQTFVTVAAILFVTSILASLIPAARAASINPQVAIRHQ
jgi:putative ABC transport system permease protein